MLLNEAASLIGRPMAADFGVHGTPYKSIDLGD
jgi:hypothetical protein